MSPEQRSVQQLASKTSRLEAMRELLGAVNARQLRDVTVTDAVFDALVEGLSDPNPQVRFWSVQLLDHCPDPRAIVAIEPLLDDPVPRVRRNAVHAMSCGRCKPAWSGTLDERTVAKIEWMSTGDENPKVRSEAAAALERQRTTGDELVGAAGIRSTLDVG
jgi:HEAT repeat protein